MLGKQSKVLFAMIKDIQQDIRDLRHVVQPLVERDGKSSAPVSGVFVPGVNEEYWYIGYDGGVYSRRNVKHKRDIYKISVRNCFRTKQGAQDHKEYVLMRIELHNLGKELDVKVQRHLNPDLIHKSPVYTLALQYDLSGTKVVSSRLTSGLGESSTIFIKSKSSNFGDVALSKYGYEALLKFLSYQE